MNNRYDHKEAEPRLSEFWEANKVYAFDHGSKKRIYSIDTPPPTISGLIHVGHVFSFSQADFVSRYKRMKGFNVFYPFGFDNDGLPTELLVEKLHNTTAEKLGREKFIALVEEETAKYEKMYRELWENVGISVDWSLFYTTISKDVQRISQLSFLELNKINRVYRKETPTIWCTKDKTSLSQMELKDRVIKSKFVNLHFSDDIVIATTRPELLPACVAIFVNPEDQKNKKHIGEKVKVPIFGQEVKILADKRVNPEKGTGIVMCCTFGDLTDIEWYKAYNLDLKIVIDNGARMLVEPYKGMKIKEARQKIIEDLKQKGYLTDEVEVEHSVNVHERCGTEIEFLVKKQWFVKYLDIREKLLELGRKVKWHPDYMVVRYENWVNGLQWDWSISRQRYYGIPFPVWYCKNCDEILFADEKDLPVNPITTKTDKKCAQCGSSEMVPETDVMDTWATSSLTPLINAKWGSKENYMDRIYPMDLRPQAHDIISFWLFTTIVKAYLHTKKLPWKNALISGHGLDPSGKPMHKSAGNVIEPKPYIEKYGADALRHWASLSRLGDDASFQEKDLITGYKLVNKLWNVAKFVSGNFVYDECGISNVIDRWILSRTSQMVKIATDHFEEYDYAGAKRVIDEFFWFFTDNYIEFVKYRVYKGDKAAKYALSIMFLILIKLYAPFLPFIAEEIYQSLYADKEKAKSVHLSKWIESEDILFDRHALELGDTIQKIIAAIRLWKHNEKLALNAELSEVVIDDEMKEGEEDIKGAINIKKISRGKGDFEVPDTKIKIKIIK